MKRLFIAINIPQETKEKIFTAFYSGITSHTLHFKFLYFGLDGNYTLVPFMWSSAILAAASIVMLLVPKWRKNEKILIWASLFVFFSIWLDKGLGMIVAGFTPTVMDYVVSYFPTITELLITLGIFAMGALVITGLYKIALTLRRQLKSS